jgi:hypothetical protein
VIRGHAPRTAVAATCAVLALAGCQADLRRTVAAIDDAYAGGRYEGAASIAEDAARRYQDDRIDRVLWWLESGRTQQAAGRIPESMAWYDRAYEEVRPYLDSKAEATVSEALVTTAVNQAMRTYRATPPERVMLCALQGANALCAGDLARARVEFNRTADFQQDAAARFAKEINAAQDQANAAWRKEGRPVSRPTRWARCARRRSARRLRRSASGRSRTRSPVTCVRRSCWPPAWTRVTARTRAPTCAASRRWCLGSCPRPRTSRSSTREVGCLP